MGELVLSCKDLHKRIGKKEILKGVTVNLYEEDILGFIGPNGARKNYYYQADFGFAKYY